MLKQSHLDTTKSFSVGFSRWPVVRQAATAAVDTFAWLKKTSTFVYCVFTATGPCSFHMVAEHYF